MKRHTYRMRALTKPLENLRSLPALKLTSIPAGVPDARLFYLDMVYTRVLRPSVFHRKRHPRMAGK